MAQNYGTPIQPKVQINDVTDAQTATPATVQSPQPVKTPELTEYEKLAQARPSNLEFYKTQSQELGIPEQQKIASTLREQIGSLSEQIKKVKPQIAGTTRDSFVTESQRGIMQQRAEEPLREQLTSTTEALGRTQEDINAASDNLARMQTAFSQDNETQLNLALAKIQRGEQLTDIEREQAFQLLQKENDYKFQKDMLSKQFANDKELAKLQQKLSIEQFWKTRTGGGGGGSTSTTADISKYLPNAQSLAQGKTQTITAPPNGPYKLGAQVEYPKGSGTYWTYTTGGWK